MYFSGQMASKSRKGEELISIGELSRLTGIGVDTLRVWEKRYGEPRARRLPSGHRRYSPAQVPRLRQVADAIAMGGRPGKIFRLEPAELDALVEPTLPGHTRNQDKLLRLVREYRGRDLERELQRGIDKLGLETWISTVAAPLLDRVGRDWAEGHLEVRHEHFLSEILEDTLRKDRIQRAARKRGKHRKPSFLFTTLPGERHGLGLQMAASMCVEYGFPMRILGCDTPLEDIVSAATDAGVDVLAISVSLSSAGPSTDRVLRSLREALPETVEMLVGGAGAKGPRRGVDRVHYAGTMEELSEFLESSA